MEPVMDGRLMSFADMVLMNGLCADALSAEAVPD